MTEYKTLSAFEQVELQKKLAEANKKLAEQTSKAAQMEIKRDVAVSSLQLSQENHREATKALSIACGEIKELREQVAKAKEEGRAEAQARIKVLEDGLRLLSLYVAANGDDWVQREAKQILGSANYPAEALDKVVREAVAVARAEGIEEGKKLAVPEGWQAVPKIVVGKMGTYLCNCDIENGMTPETCTAQDALNGLLAAAPTPEKEE